MSRATKSVPAMLRGIVTTRPTDRATRPAAVEALEPRTLFSTYIVTGLGDGAGTVNSLLPGIFVASTLRAAVTAANVTSSTDVILLNPVLAGTVSLDPGLGELTIATNVTLQGFGADRQAIDAGGAGRALTVQPGMKVCINNVTISGGNALNIGGGGIRNFGVLTLRGCTFRDNTIARADGGGVFSNGTLNVSGCTFLNNTSDSSGGGLFSSGVATVTNSTFFNNSAHFGGGLYNFEGRPMEINNCTVAGNHAMFGGGVAGTVSDATFIPPTTRLNNTIVAGNTLSDVAGRGPDLYGYFVESSSNNLIGAVGTASGLNSAFNILGAIQFATPAIDPLLAPLRYYGGATQTMPLLAGSPAFNAGKNGLVPLGIFTDQRGFIRIAAGIVDIGATEGVL